MRMHALATIGLFAASSLLSACSSKSVSYSDPTTPTGSQTQAVTSLTDVGAHVTAAFSGMSDANKAFGVHSLMASLQGTAVNQSSSSQGLSLALEGIDAACTSGTAATGFTYTNCMLDGGQGSINGSVKITPTSVTYDLKVSVSASGTSTNLTLSGTMTNTAGRLTGNLEYKIHIDISGVGGLGGLGGGGGSTDITTTADWDMTYTETPSCITGGSVEVKVDSAGTLRGAKFLFSGCNAVMVQNG